MKSISKFLTNLKDLLPYLLLIAIYFFFVNLEAGKINKSESTNQNEYMLTDEDSRENIKQQRIKIPVTPYKQ